ncbi:MAG: type I restriction endonuclease subunit R [Peptococcaceae bacterium]|nr:MAG: type I restriction endonuclease subunit R [Peptococcaceae bacterium]
MLFQFIYTTQPREWEKLKAQHGAEVKQKFLRRLVKEIERRGTLDVLRKGIKDYGCKFQLAYFAPASALNVEHVRAYRGNILSVIRQLKYSEKSEKSLDLVLFLNGLPVVTAELKNHLTGQTVEDAVRQYRKDRNPREPLLSFGRCLVHLAVDDDLVYMTTRLEGKNTRFLPFNQGRDGGAGNPDNPGGYRSAYLWEEIWQKDLLLEIIARFLHLKEEEKNGKTTKTLIFPRYHQLYAVRRLVAGAKKNGPGESYLIQHSAGSGKSNTIAWLCHQLSGLHDDADRRVFDSIIVISDRRVLDRQLQNTIQQFEQTKGVVEKIDKHSSQLKQALEEGKNIIVTTLQKFPFVTEELGSLPGKKFAVVIDEAHSSQTGESTKSLKAVLTAANLEEAEKQDAVEEDVEEEIIREMQRRGRQPNVSWFAFTATPKTKTLELFGEKQPDGSFVPFSLYTMRQAIEEGFILDVLENYMTFKVYFSLFKKIEADPKYDKKKATYLLRSFADLHDHAITKKTELIVEHFCNHTKGKIGGRAKAMLITRSRLHAVRYKLAFDRYIKQKGYHLKTLVAFSGAVNDGGLEYTEAGMNSTPGNPIPESATADTFALDDYRIIIAANKFQTGFDQPLLHTMYVDKKLGGVNAVQTLSRLNRVYPGKDDTMVLDFANEAWEIQEAFAPYYEKTILSEGTDPNKLYDLQRAILEFHLFVTEEVDRFAGVFFSSQARQEKLYALLDPIVTRYTELSAEEQDNFKRQLTDYVRLYAFLAQVITFTDAELEKLYVFGRMLLRKLPAPRNRLPVEITENINMNSYRIQKMTEGKINLAGGEGVLEPLSGLDAGRRGEPEIEPLSQIIQDINTKYGTNFTEADKVFFAELQTRLSTNQTLIEGARVNSKENLQLAYNHMFMDELQTMIDTNFEIYKRITDDEDFGKFIMSRMFELVYDRLQQGEI